MQVINRFGVLYDGSEMNVSYRNENVSSFLQFLPLNLFEVSVW